MINYNAGSAYKISGGYSSSSATYSTGNSKSTCCQRYLISGQRCYNCPG